MPRSRGCFVVTRRRSGSKGATASKSKPMAGPRKRSNSSVRRFPPSSRRAGRSKICPRSARGSARWSARSLRRASSRVLTRPWPHFRQRLPEDLYAALSLPYIPPELREGRGEVDAARNGRLPALIGADHLRGDLHAHTTASDGTNSIAEMAAAAQARGYRYIGITDHSKSLRIARGLTETQLRQQLDAIDALNADLKGFVVLKSAEVDILEDGTLDYPDTVLRELDYTICSIHSHFRRTKSQQTARILRAMDNPYFTILGHATGRLLLHREGYELDMNRLIAHAKQAGCFFEINSSPNRLDLSDEHARLAKEAGVKIAINTDAHSIAELRFISAGLNQARRAWLEPTDVLNTLPLSNLRRAFRRR